MRLHTQDFDNNIDWNKDDDDYTDVLASIRDFRIFDPIEEVIQTIEWLRGNKTVIEDINEELAV